VRRRLYWIGVLLTVGLLAAGIAVGTLGYAKTSGPDGAVRAYFAALAHADAADALAYGDVPAGPHTLLTETVLREQLRIAPLQHFSIVSTKRHGAKATVQVKYTLAFTGRDQQLNVSVPVHEDGGDGWRLDQAAVPTELHATNAAQRETIIGGQIPAGKTLLFPGALPVRVDTPYLELDPAEDYVAFGAQSTTPIVLQVSAAAGKDLPAARRALRAWKHPRDDQGRHPGQPDRPRLAQPGRRAPPRRGGHRQWQLPPTGLPQ
jgi:hypothetical protein